MSNSLFNQFGRQNNPLEQLAQQAREFQKQFKGIPRQEVDRLLQTGQMSPSMLNLYSHFVQQMAPIMENH